MQIYRISIPNTDRIIEVNKREHRLFEILRNEELIRTPLILEDLGVNLKYLRVIVNNFNKKLTPHAEIIALYDTGYRIKFR